MRGIFCFRFVEQKTLCGLKSYNSDPNFPICHSKSGILKLLAINYKFSVEDDANEMLALTNGTCRHEILIILMQDFYLNNFRPSCTRFEYESVLKESVQVKMKPTHGTRVRLGFDNGRYDERTEFLVYDANSFIADVGGYLGQLLGHSILRKFRVALEFFTLSNY